MNTRIQIAAVGDSMQHLRAFLEDSKTLRRFGAWRPHASAWRAHAMGRGVLEKTAIDSLVFML